MSTGGSGRIGSQRTPPPDPNASTNPDPTNPDPDVIPQTATGPRTKNTPLNKRRLRASGLSIPIASLHQHQPEKDKISKLAAQLMRYTRNGRTDPKPEPKRPKLDASSQEAPLQQATLSHSGPNGANGLTMNLIHKGEVELYAHPISTNPDQAEAIWALAEKAETEKIIALQDFTFVASPYLPADDTNEGQFGNFKVKILAKKPLPEISPKAFSLTVNVTNEETGKEREVNIDQFFMWGDDKGLDKNLADQLVRRVPMNKCQIHCLQGVGRTGTLILMKLMQVAADNQELTRDNLVDFIASNIREGRVQRESPEYVKTEAQFKSLMEFGMGLTKATVDNIEQQLS